MKRTFGEAHDFPSKGSRPPSKRNKVDSYPETDHENWVSHDFEHGKGSEAPVPDWAAAFGNEEDPMLN